MNIVTKTGDKGTTALFGGVRVPKNNIRIECNGQLDELNVRIGALRTQLPENHEWDKGLHRVQMDIMLLMSHVATTSESNKKNTKKHPKDGIIACEQWIEQLSEGLESELSTFTLPGGTTIAVACHLARTAARTAERLLVAAYQQEQFPEYILEYVNRLSDLFYILAIKDLKDNNIKAERFVRFNRKNK